MMHVSRDPIRRPQGDDIFNIAATEVAPTFSFTGFADAASRLGEWDDKVQRIAWITRAIKKWKGYKRQLPIKTSPPSPISSIERTDAEIILLRGIQDLHFSKERQDLRSNDVSYPNSRKEMKNKGSSIRSLNPFIGQGDLVRIGSRILYSTMRQSTPSSSHAKTQTSTP